MLLTPYRVLDLTGPLGYLAGRVLADLGADVVKVEPPGGDPARRWPPLVSLEPARGAKTPSGRAGGGVPGALEDAASSDAGAQSAYWLALNANKRGVEIDLATDRGRARLRALARRADFVIESFAPGELDRLGLGYAQLGAERPGLIYVAITPFGQEGPYREYLASDLEIMALSGAMSLAGDEDGEPMRVTVPQAPLWAGVEAAMGALTALAYRTRTGIGQFVDVSAQAAVISALAHAPVFWDLTGVNPQRAGIYVTGRSVTGAKMRAFWQCRDGWINFIIYGGAAGRQTNRQLVAWMDERGMGSETLTRVDWDRFTVTELSQAQVDDLEAPIARFFATLTKQEFLDGAVARQIMGYPVFNVADIRGDRQLAAREFWQEVALTDPRMTMTFPGGFAIVNGKRLPIRRPPPALGEHDNEVGAAEADLARST